MQPTLDKFKMPHISTHHFSVKCPECDVTFYEVAGTYMHPTSNSCSQSDFRGEFQLNSSGFVVFVPEVGKSFKEIYKAL